MISMTVVIAMADGRMGIVHGVIRMTEDGACLYLHGLDPQAMTKVEGQYTLLTVSLDVFNGSGLHEEWDR